MPEKGHWDIKRENEGRENREKGKQKGRGGKRQKTQASPLTSLVTQPSLRRSLLKLIFLTSMQQHLVPLRSHIPLVSLGPIIRDRVSKYRPCVVKRRTNHRARYGIEC